MYFKFHSSVHFYEDFRYLLRTRYIYSKFTSELHSSIVVIGKKKEKKKEFSDRHFSLLLVGCCVCGVRGQR